MTAEQLDLLGLIREKRAERARLENQEPELRQVVSDIYSKCEGIVSAARPQKSVNLAGEDEEPIMFHITYDHHQMGRAPINLKLNDFPQSLTVNPYYGEISFWQDERHPAYDRLADLEEARAYAVLVDIAIEKLSDTSILPNVSHVTRPV